MRHLWKRPSRLQRANRLVSIGLLLLAMLVLASPQTARAGQLAWLDEVVQQVVREAGAGGRAAVRGGDATGTTARAAGRLFVHEADEGLGLAAGGRSEEMARGLAAASIGPLTPLLQGRFAKLLRHDPEAIHTFNTLAPAEKRLVVEMGETAQRLARRYPGEAETVIRCLGTEGPSAVHVYGDDVAEGLVKEGPESLGVLRKTEAAAAGRSSPHEALPHKKKLAAAGVLAAFLYNLDKFVDYAGRATDYAVREFAKAGIQLAGAVGGGATHGLETAISQALANHGLDYAVLRYGGMALAGLVVVMATMVLLGIPVAWMLRPFTWPKPGRPSGNAVDGLRRGESTPWGWGTFRHLPRFSSDPPRPAGR